MDVKFEELAEDSRIWIYQSNREFTEEEVLKIIEGFKSYKIGKELVEKVLKIQNLVSEIEINGN